MPTKKSKFMEHADAVEAWGIDPLEVYKDITVDKAGQTVKEALDEYQAKKDAEFKTFLEEYSETLNMTVAPDSITGTVIKTALNLPNFTRLLSEQYLRGVSVGLTLFTDHISPKIEAKHTKELHQAWQEGSEQTAEWMANNPSPAGIPHDPPSNPYPLPEVVEEEAGFEEEVPDGE